MVECFRRYNRNALYGKCNVLQCYVMIYNCLENLDYSNEYDDNKGKFPDTPSVNTGFLVLFYCLPYTARPRHALKTFVRGKSSMPTVTWWLPNGHEWLIKESWSRGGPIPSLAQYAPYLYYPGLKITVGYRIISDPFWKVSDPIWFLPDISCDLLFSTCIEISDPW